MKNLLFVVLVLVLVILGGFFFVERYFTPDRQIEERPATKQSMVSYARPDFGLFFEYPSGLYLKARESRADSISSEFGLVLVPDTKENRDVVDGVDTSGREGPPAITLEIYPNPRKLASEEWLNASTNWLKSFSNSGTDVVVAGIFGRQYLFDGLYPGKSIIIQKDLRVFVFSVSWLSKEDQLLKDFDMVLRSVRFE